MSILDIFANISEEEEIFFLTVSEIAWEQIFPLTVSKIMQEQHVNRSTKVYFSQGNKEDDKENG